MAAAGRCRAALAGAALLLASAAAAQPATLADAIAGLVAVGHDSLPQGAERRFPQEWCLTSASDPRTNAWEFRNPVSGRMEAVPVRHAFQVPFQYRGHLADGTRAWRLGAIVVGYDIGALPVPPTAPQSAMTGMADALCALGPAIAARAPFPITALGRKGASLAALTQTDPAHEQRAWTLSGKALRVRHLQRIPATYDMNGRAVQGSILVAFSP